LSEVICDTSPIQYLHQVGLLSILPALIGEITIPPAVVNELAVGRELGISLPGIEQLDWIAVQQPAGQVALPLVNDLGSGEAEVLLLALESREPVVVLDDALARRVAEALDLPLTGTLGLLLDAKQADLITEIKPVLDQLDALRFRLADHTRHVYGHYRISHPPRAHKREVI
jgi:uncharacterized protein